VSGPDSPPDPISEDKLFDVASLTKVVALTTALAVLVDEGSLGLDSPVRHHLPQWGAHIEGVAQGKFVPTPSQPVPPAPATLATPGNNPSPSALPPLPYAAWNDKRELTTLRHLLTHTAGLPAGGAYAGKYVTLDQVVTDIARARPLSLPGRTFLYSDYSAILLGAVIESERSNLDLFCREAVFRPLRMDSTMYRPPLRELMRCAHTTPPDAPVPSPGLVHDPTARALGGVSGNAGLFSTADDLARFCLMWLSYGQIHDPAPNGPKRLLSEKTVREFTRAQIGYGEGKRALGWDMDSAFSIRGDFAPGSYGHTGYTGTSLWLDPQTGVFVVLLTNAVHGPETARQTLIKTRRVISSLVAASVVA
jgi:CubicO group peptidase (beta-lactamase class C family)